MENEAIKSQAMPRSLSAIKLAVFIFGIGCKWFFLTTKSSVVNVLNLLWFSNIVAESGQDQSAAGCSRPGAEATVDAGHLNASPGVIPFLKVTVPAKAYQCVQCLCFDTHSGGLSINAPFCSDKWKHIDVKWHYQSPSRSDLSAKNLRPFLHALSC